MKDTNGAEWQLNATENETCIRLTLLQGDSSIILPDFFMISPSRTKRLSGFANTLTETYLPKKISDAWFSILSERALEDEEVIRFLANLRETPMWFYSMLVEAITNNSNVNIDMLIPSSECYYGRLLGEYECSANIIEYTEMEGSEHIQQLVSWSPLKGFLLSLLLCSHSSISSVNAFEQLDGAGIIDAFKWILYNGDLISKVGAVEIGFSILDKVPEIEDYIHDIIKLICNDNAEDSYSHFNLISSLIVLVENEFSRRKILNKYPIFWRRLASIAHASLISRVIIEKNIDIAEFATWAVNNNSLYFRFQTLVELRLEPRWLPDYIYPNQFKMELISRIFLAAHKYEEIIKDKLRHIIFDEVSGVKSFIKIPASFLPGPLEGGTPLQIEVYEELEKIIREQLDATDIGLRSFVALVNSARVFQLKLDHMQLATNALRRAKYQLRNLGDKNELLGVLVGLASAAATARNCELAAELKILVRKYRFDAEYKLSVSEALEVCLIAAASHQDIVQWSNFVGEWITELSFQPLDRSEVRVLHLFVISLCHIEARLWVSCGKAEAALKSLI